MRYLRILLALVLVAMLTACGGGGGSAGTPAGTGGTTGTTTSSTTGSPTVSISLASGTGAVSSVISVGGSFIAKATVKDGSGAAVVNRLVTFSLGGGSIATLSPSTALTDAAGIAQVSIAPASVTTVGAATISATALVNGSTVSGQMDFSVSQTNLSLTPIVLGSTSLASGGNTSLSVSALVDGVASTGTSVNITFSASCGRINGSGSSFGVTTSGSGVASAVYTAVGSDGTLCNGPVTLSASSAGATPRTSVVAVAAPLANAITFASATPSQIFVAGSGALEQSLVTFKVFAGSSALSNVTVTFSLVVNPGGVGLNGAGSTAPVKITTNSTGEAIVSVFSGTIPGPVKVKATLGSDSSVFAESQNLSVSSGPPSQRFMSLSVSTFNIEGWGRDGTATQLTARLADRQGNPVEDGTVVNFTAEGGQVASSCATLKSNGISSCTVDFISQNPRPVGGRVSVLAFASGTKDYVDVNGNNIYDIGTDVLTQIGDAYRDDDEDGTYDAGEFVVPRGGTLSCTGSGRPFPGRAGTCDPSLATTVRQQTVLLYASTNPSMTVVTNSVSYFEFELSSSDNLLLPLPAGTTIAVEMGDASPSNGLGCELDKLFGTTVANISPPISLLTSMATTHSATLKGCVPGDIISVKVTVPSGLQTIIPVVLK